MRYHGCTSNRCSLSRVQIEDCCRGWDRPFKRRPSGTYTRLVSSRPSVATSESSDARVATSLPACYMMGTSVLYRNKYQTERTRRLKRRRLVYLRESFTRFPSARVSTFRLLEFNRNDPSKLGLSIGGVAIISLGWVPNNLLGHFH